MPVKPRATIRDVAERSGYSIYTVSSVLNNKGDIGEETSKKIRDAARTLNYGILGTAPSQRRMTARCLGIVLPNADCLHVGFYNRALSRFRAVASRHDYDCKLFTEEDLARRTDPRRSGGPGIFGCKGLILFCPWADHHAYLEPLLNQGVAVALIRREAEPATGLLQVNDNQAESIRDLFRYLHDRCGSRRFALVAPASTGATRHMALWQRRIETFTSETPVPGSILHLNEHPERRPEAYAPLAGFLRGACGERSSVVAWSDTCAARVLSHLQREGFRVPEDVMLTGYNNDSVSLDTSPSLTTVHTPVEDMIEQAFNYLMEYREEGTLPPARRITLPYRILPRDTTRELPS